MTPAVSQRYWGWLAAAGAAGWLAVVALEPFDELRAFGHVGYALALAPLVIVPLALSMLATPSRAGRVSWSYEWPAVLHPLSATLAVVALSRPQGELAALLALPYLAETVALALFGVVRLAGHGTSSLDEVAIDVGLLYLPVGGAWWLATCAGWTFGFSSLIVQLTAVHFHFAGFAVAVLAGLTGRAVSRGSARARRAYRFGTVAAISSPLLVGLGIAISPAVEVVAAGALVVGLTLLAGVLALHVAPRRPRASGLLLGLASASLIGPMALAFAYAIGEARGSVTVDLRTMAHFHGLLNAFGFALCGLLGWRLACPPTRCAAPRPPFSRLAAGLHVGADFFDRRGLVDERSPVRGFVADLGVYGSDFFDSDAVAPLVRHFYEGTAEFAIGVRARWAFGFRLAGRLFRSLAARVGQLNLPLDSARDSEMLSRLFAIRSEVDGRQGVRVWVRTYAASGEPVYVAAYSTHCHDGVPYMNIAFPLPGGNLTSLLRMERLPEAPEGLRLSTLPAGDQNGDEGVYYANRVLPVRLPLDETITVWPHALAPADRPAELEATGRRAVFARHDLWVFGLRYLRIDYLLELRD